MRCLVGLALAGCRIGFDATGAVPDDALDAVLDATSDPCTAPTAIACLDFTTTPDVAYSFGDASWSATGGRAGGGVIVRGTAVAPAGIAIEWSPPVTSGMLYQRVHARIRAGAPITVYGAMLQLDNGVDTLGMEKYSVDLASQGRIQIASPFSGGVEQTTDTLPRDTWLCLELTIHIQATSTGTATLHSNGVEIIATSPRVTLVPGGYTRALVEAIVSSSDPDLEVEYDDLIVATEASGC